MAERARIGIINTSWWANLMYLPALKSHPRAEIAAICGRNGERAAGLATEHGIPQVFTDYREMLEKGGLDGVIVAAPDDQHKPMVIEAARRGVHVLCDKPLALNAADAEAMYEAVKAAGVLHMVMFTWRWPPAVQYLKELVDGGYVGKLYRARFAYTSGVWRNERYEWRRDGDRANGILGDIGSHMIDLAQWIVGDIVSVSAHAPTLVASNGLDGHRATSDAAHLTIVFSNGGQGIVDATALQQQGDCPLRIEIHLDGEAGSLDLVFAPFGTGAGTWVRGARNDDKIVTDLAVPDRFYRGLDPSDFDAVFNQHSVGARLFVDAILGGFQPQPGLEAGVAVQKVIDAALKSHRERRWIDLI